MDLSGEAAARRRVLEAWGFNGMLLTCMQRYSISVADCKVTVSSRTSLVQVPIRRLAC